MPLVLSGTSGISTNGSNWGLQLDSSGRVSMPNQIAFCVSIPRDNYTTVASGSTVTLPFYNAVFNKGNCYNTSTYRFTAPVAGIYFFYGTYLYQGGSASTHNQLQFVKNGVSDIFNGGVVYSTQGSWGTYQKHQRSDIVSLAANDYIEMKVYHDAGVSNNVREGMCEFLGYLVQ